MMKRSLLFLLGAFLALGTIANAQAPAKFSAVANKSVVKSGEEFLIKMKITLKGNWYTYGMKEVIGPDGLGPTPTDISLLPKNIVELKGKVIESTPKSKMDHGFNTTIYYHKGSSEYLLRVIAKKDLNLAKDKLTVVAYAQFCDSTCIPPDEYKVAVSAKEFALTAADSAMFRLTAAAKAQEQAEVQQTATPGVEPGNTELKQAPTGGMQTESQKEINQKKTEGVLSFLWFAMSAGALALMTPCVFPMVPITVSFFTKRAEISKGKGLRDSIVYALGIIFTFTALGMLLAAVFGATGIRDFASNGWVNMVIAAIFIVFAMNLFGAFEIQLPTSLLNKLNAKSQGNGIVSVLLMGLTFSLTSFTCTVPFVGSALISASGGDWFYPIVGMLGFSGVFAAPFFLLALFPSAMKALPKAGGWMNNVKVVMGFLEIAFAIKFVSNADLVWNWGIMPKELFLAIWIAAGILIVMYVLGLYRLKHDAPVDGVGSARLVWAMFFGAVVFYLLTGLFGKQLGELDAFLPPAEYREIMSAGNGVTASAPTAKSVTTSSQTEEVWLDNYDLALAEAKKQNKPLFVDFTGFTCTNCRWMEQNMFKKESIISRMSGFVKVKLYTDRNQEPFLTNKKMQKEKYGSIELPLYVILDPNGNLIGTKTFDRDENTFVNFMDKGLASVK